jgi:NADPH:quinone reductase-like Zn-dependent oxidoreductase
VVSANDGNKVDRVVDVEFGANLSQILACINISGVIATYSSTQVKEPQLPFMQMMFMDLTLRMVIVYAMPEDAKLEAITDINKALNENKLSHRIAHTLPFEQMAKSHELIEQGGFRGCVVVDIDE